MYKQQYRHVLYGKLLILFLVLTFLIAPIPSSAAGNRRLYLPLTIKQDAGVTSDLIMLGIYPANWWDPSPNDVINNLFEPMNTWSGKRLSIAGFFHKFEQPGNMDALKIMWDRGYTPFVNISVDVTAAQVANGAIDSFIHQWAHNYLSYVNNGQRMAFLAPMQEMNYPVAAYAMDPANFKLAYQHIQNIFNQEGVPRSSVKWVFAPNGYSKPYDPGFESYYPGDDRVDVVAFSSYNFGFNPLSAYGGWLYYDQVFTPYLDRIRAMAPSKPIFIAQTGTSAYTVRYGVDHAAKDQWLRDAYNYLANYKGVRAIIYLNTDIDFDWQIYYPGVDEFTGYRDGVANNAYGYISPEKLKNSDLTVH